MPRLVGNMVLKHGMLFWVDTRQTQILQNKNDYIKCNRLVNKYKEIIILYILNKICVSNKYALI